MTRRMGGPVISFVILALCIYMTVALNSSFMYLIFLSGNVIFSLAVGLIYNRLAKAYFSEDLPVNERAVFITGCDTGLGYCIAEHLSEQGFEVFAGCMNIKSEGAKSLASREMHVVQLDYLKQDSLVKAFRSVTELLRGKRLWAVVANAGVTTYGEVDWMLPQELRWLVAVNVAGTVNFVKMAIPIVKKSSGRIVLITGLHGRVAIPGMVVSSATAAALTSFADGLRRELCKFGVQVCTVEPAFYRTRIMDHDNITAALAEVIHRLPNIVREEYGGAYLESYRFLYPKKMKRLARADLTEVSSAVVKCLVNRETNSRYQCCSGRQFLTWLVLEFLPQPICDFFLVKQFAPRIRVRGNIRIRNIMMERVSRSDSLMLSESSHIAAPITAYETPPILRPPM